jgi:hypothetical protein
VKNIFPIASLVDIFISIICKSILLSSNHCDAFAELEANLLSERTKKGLESARARGRKGGRPALPVLLTPVFSAISAPVSFCSSYKNLISRLLWSGNADLKLIY